MCFEYTAEDVLVVLTDDCMLYLLKPREDIPETKDLTADIGNTLVEGGKVHENILVLLTSSKKVFIINNLNDCKAKFLCEKPYCTFLP